MSTVYFFLQNCAHAFYVVSIGLLTYWLCMLNDVNSAVLEQREFSPF